MKFLRFYLLILVMVFSFSSVVQAQSSGEDFEGQVKDIAINKSKSFFYLLGSAGNNNESYSGLDFSGFAVAIIGGWQQSKFFAMEVSAGYSDALSSKVDARYSLLFQPNIKLSKSWSILPKVGAGLAFSSALTDYGYYSSTTDDFNLGLYGTLGLKFAYNRVMFGVSYEHTAISFLGTDFRIVAEAGIKF